MSDEFFEGLEHMGWAAVFRRLAGRPVGTRRPTYTPRSMMATRYQCLCTRSTRTRYELLHLGH